MNISSNPVNFKQNYKQNIIKKAKDEIKKGNLISDFEKAKKYFAENSTKVTSQKLAEQKALKLLKDFFV